MLTQSTASREYVKVPMAAKRAGVAYDPTGDVVQMAFLTAGTAPVSGDWNTASWDTDATTSPATYYAQCLVGPSGTVTLTAATYAIWVKVTDSPEAPVKRAGQLKIF